jgi:membrane protein DedA with SNARE-associated domain
MHQTLQFLIAHGYTILFVWVMAEQLGLPLPSVPLLLAAGALAGVGRLGFAFAAAVASVAALLADLLWYEIGRRRGAKVLNLLCRIALEPDSCVRRMEGTFTDYGARALVVAKFVPGLSTVAPPLAGIFKVPWPRFLAFDTLGTLVWVGAFTGIGYLFSSQLEEAAVYAAGLGATLSVIVFGLPVAYVLWKYLERRRFIRRLRIARISPEELHRKMDSGEEVLVVDLRHSLDFDADPEMIPGAIHRHAEELEKNPLEIPRDKEIVLYCT